MLDGVFISISDIRHLNHRLTAFSRLYSSGVGAILHLDARHRADAHGRLLGRDPAGAV